MDQKDMIFREYLTGHRKERQTLAERRAYKDLDPETQTMLESIYQYGRVEAVEPLAPDERSQFSGGLPAFNFHLQTLYKCSANLEPDRLILEIQRMMEQEECLRRNYCFLRGEMRRVILSAREDKPNIICQDLRHLEPVEQDVTLERVMEADMRQAFDLQKGALFRVSSFRTGAMEYAVLVTVSKLIASEFPAERLFGTLGADGSAAEQEQNAPSGAKAYPSSDEKENPEAAVSQSMPYERAPHGEYQQMIHRILLPGNISSALSKRASGNRKLLLAALETAWGLLLMENKNSEDTCSPLLLPAHENASDSFFMVPVCLKKDGDVSIEHTIEEQAGQIEGKIKAGRIYPVGMMCSHFLSFYGFMQEAKAFSASEALPAGNIIARNLWAAEGITLGVYFQWKNGHISMAFLYDKSRFKPYSVELISQKYLQMLQKMLFDWKQPLSDFTLSQQVPKGESGIASHTNSEESSRSGIYDTIAEIGFIKGVQPDILIKDIRNPRRAVYANGKSISRTDIEENFIFLVRGRVLRSIASGGELSNYLDIRTEDAWLNESVLLPDKKSKLFLEIVSEDATLMFIPIKEMNRLMNDEPHIMRRMLLYSVSETNKYHRLWAQV